MKHPRCVNQTYIPWSTICPTDTKFFVIVRMCKMFISFPSCLTWFRGTSPTCSMVCEVSSPVSMTPDYFSFSICENHSSWLVIWFDTPESTYHILFRFKVFTFIELSLCFITKPGPVPFLPLEHRHSATFDASLPHPGSIRIGSNRSASSSTCSLDGPSGHSTSNPGFPCRFAAPAWLPLLLEGSELLSETSLSCRLSFRMIRTYTPTHRDRPAPFRTPQRSRVV